MGDRRRCEAPRCRDRLPRRPPHLGQSQTSLHRFIWDAWNDGLAVAGTSRKGGWARLVARFHLGYRGQRSAGSVGTSRAAPSHCGSRGPAPSGHLGDGISRDKVRLQSHAGRRNGCRSWEDRRVCRGGLTDPRRHNEVRRWTVFRHLVRGHGRGACAQRWPRRGSRFADADEPVARRDGRGGGKTCPQIR